MLLPPVVVLPTLMEGDFGAMNPSEQLSMVAMATSVAERDGDTMMQGDALLCMVAQDFCFHFSLHFTPSSTAADRRRRGEGFHEGKEKKDPGKKKGGSVLPLALGASHHLIFASQISIFAMLIYLPTDCVVGVK